MKTARIAHASRLAALATLGCSATPIMTEAEPVGPLERRVQSILKPRDQGKTTSLARMLKKARGR